MEVNSIVITASIARRAVGTTGHLLEKAKDFMFSKTTLSRFSLGATGALWLALSFVQSVNAASVKGSTFNFQPVSTGSVNGKAGTTSSDDTSSEDTVEFVITTASLLAILADATDPILQLLFDDDSQNTGSNKGSDSEGPPGKDSYDFTTSRPGFTANHNKTPVRDISSVGEPSPGPTPVPTPVPTPALLPALIGLGLKMRQKTRLEKSSVLEEA